MRKLFSAAIVAVLGTVMLSPAASFADIPANDGQYDKFGIIAHEWEQKEAETNAAVNEIDAQQQSGNDLTNGSVAEQPWLIGDVDGSLLIKGNPAVVYTPNGNADSIRHESGDIEIKDIDKGDIEKFVDDALKDAYSNILEYGEMKRDIAHVDGSIIDVSDKDDIVVVGIDNLNNLQAEQLKLKVSDKQVVVVYDNTDGDVNLQKYGMYVGDVYRTSDNTNQDAWNLVNHMIYAFPSAKVVNINGSVCGRILAPNATVYINATSAGFIRADKVVSGNGEWHNVKQDCNEPFVPGDDKPEPVTPDEPEPQPTPDPEPQHQSEQEPEIHDEPTEPDVPENPSDDPVEPSDEPDDQQEPFDQQEPTAPSEKPTEPVVDIPNAVRHGEMPKTGDIMVEFALFLLCLIIIVCSTLVTVINVKDIKRANEIDKNIGDIKKYIDKLDA